MKQRNFYYNTLVALVFVGTMAILGFVFIDPDFGYRMRNGEFIMREGLSFLSGVDPYSYTMPSYNFVEHSWLSAFVFYFVYSNFELFVLSVVMALVAGMSALFALKGSYQLTPGHVYKNLLFYLVAGVLMEHFGIRAQVFSWLMLSILAVLVYNKSYWERYKIFLPAIFLIWVNLHGSFLAGIAILTFWVLISPQRFGNIIGSKSKNQFVSNLKQIKLSVPKWPDIAVLVSSFTVTLVNPYGYSIWQKAGGVVSSNEIRFLIAEWMPSFFGMNFSGAFYLVLSLCFVFMYRDKIGAKRVIFYVILLIQGLLAVRNYPIFVLLTLPITAQGFLEFYKRASKIRFGKNRVIIAYKLAIVMSIVFLVVQTIIRAKPALGGESFYPDSAVSYLSQNMPDGEVFSTYGWGGYLVWKLPEKKVYINGWMPLWSRDDAPEGESRNAFRDYLDLTSGDLEYRSEFEKYNIDTVLWTQTRDRTRLERFVENLLETLSIKDKSDYIFVMEMEDDGWVRVYQDNVAVIYQRM